jgi:hypothetical protein
LTTPRTTWLVVGSGGLMSNVRPACRARQRALPSLIQGERLSPPTSYHSSVSRSK